jgi:7-carboxy-7-deazaguanine synthase
MTLMVNEIFYSIQGESSWTGLPFIFVRLTGCNLRCRYCDTRYAYEEGAPWSIEAIVDQVKRFACRRVTLTGGEPLLQAECPELVSHLLAQGLLVTLETNGSQDIGRVSASCIKIMDLKCPSSCMQDNNRWANLELLTPVDEVKFIIADRTDFEFALAAMERIGDKIPATHRLLSPAYGEVEPAQLARWMLDAHVDARMQVQLHKVIWPSSHRGV